MYSISNFFINNFLNIWNSIIVYPFLRLDPLDDLLPDDLELLEDLTLPEDLVLPDERVALEDLVLREGVVALVFDLVLVEEEFLIDLVGLVTRELVLVEPFDRTLELLLVLVAALDNLRVE
jgi:hypothetical protein